MESFASQPYCVAAVTVYVMADRGVVMVDWQLVQLRYVAGLQVHFTTLALLIACNVADEPVPTIISAPAFTVGSGTSVTGIVAVSLKQPNLSDPTTV